MQSAPYSGASLAADLHPKRNGESPTDGVVIPVCAPEVDATPFLYSLTTPATCVTTIFALTPIGVRVVSSVNVLPGRITRQDSYTPEAY